MHKRTLLISVVLLIMGSIMGYSVGASETKSHYNEQLKLDLLKGNLDNGHVFEGTLSFFGQHFYLNSEGLLQIDGFKESLCQQLYQEGYNCQAGVLITRRNSDPLIAGYETLRKAEAALERTSKFINRLTDH